MSGQNNGNVYLATEEKMREVLAGDALQNALNLVAFLRANDFTLNANEEGEGWAVGRTVGDSVGYLLANGAEQMPGPWTLWFNTCDFADDGAADEALKQTAWAHASPCGHCHAGWQDCGGGDRVIFGREFEVLCHSPLAFTNPGGETLANMQRLMLGLR